jgi:hypothetical protein
LNIVACVCLLWLFAYFLRICRPCALTRVGSVCMRVCVIPSSCASLRAPTPTCDASYLTSTRANSAGRAARKRCGCHAAARDACQTLQRVYGTVQQRVRAKRASRLCAVTMLHTATRRSAKRIWRFGTVTMRYAAMRLGQACLVGLRSDLALQRTCTLLLLLKVRNEHKHISS